MHIEGYEFLFIFVKRSVNKDCRDGLPRHYQGRKPNGNNKEYLHHLEQYFQELLNK